MFHVLTLSTAYRLLTSQTSDNYWNWRMEIFLLPIRYPILRSYPKKRLCRHAALFWLYPQIVLQRPTSSQQTVKVPHAAPGRHVYLPYHSNRSVPGVATPKTSFTFVQTPHCRSRWPAVEGVGLRPLAFWDSVFESCRGHGCLL